ncbi:MAG: DNA cytosine methyltransferase [Salinivirgaceae bacterium]|nr:DNA cytosine methyltransferase [Salinivirgaceae bacterium]
MARRILKEKNIKMKGQLSLFEFPESLDNANLSEDYGFINTQGYQTSNEYTSFDLFSGCGGLTKGLQMVGVKSIFASDIDENCEKTFARNFGNTPFLCKDITQITKEEVDKLTNNAVPDIIVGGPPCQGFSLANKNRNKVADDPRNKLFYGFVKFIQWYSPKAFVMENVKGLLSMLNGKVIKTIVEEFSNAGKYGYNVQYKILKASNYGVPQNRERVILIGIRKDLNVMPMHPAPYKMEHAITVDEAIMDLPQINGSEGEECMDYISKPQNDYQKLMRSNSTKVYNHIAMKHTPRLVERFKAIKAGQCLIDVWDTHGAVKRGAPTEKSNIKFSQNNQRLFGNLPAPTIAASFQSNFIHPYLNRNFTAREGARLQSFPDDFIFEGMRTKMSWEKGLSQYQQIGNAVPVLLAKAIGEDITFLLDKTL